MHEFIAVKIVPRFPSFESNCVFVIIASAKRNLNIWKLFRLYSRSRAVHRVVQRTQFTFVVRQNDVQNLGAETHSVGKDKVHREMDLLNDVCLRDAQEKAAMDKLQFVRTHDFLAVSFPLRKNSSPCDLWKAYECLQDEGKHYLTVNHRLNFVDSDKQTHSKPTGGK